jgi:hypothetical protein
MPEKTLSIAPPRPDRPPLRVNVFDAMQHGNTQLMPLFPYLYPGAMVPAGALLKGGPAADYGHFFHHNTQDEVVVTMAAAGAMLATGQVFVGARSHGVNSFLKNEKDPKAYAVMLITQRQADAGVQSEAVSVRCEKCHEEIFFKEFDATPPTDADETKLAFVSVALLPSLFADFNGEAKLRTCAKCGHVNPPFPVAAWGWDRYAEQHTTATQGRGALAEVARASGG